MSNTVGKEPRRCGVTREYEESTVPMGIQS